MNKYGIRSLARAVLIKVFNLSSVLAVISVIVVDVSFVVVDFASFLVLSRSNFVASVIPVNESCT